MSDHKCFFKVSDGFQSPRGNRNKQACFGSVYMFKQNGDDVINKSRSS